MQLTTADKWQVQTDTWPSVCVSPISTNELQSMCYTEYDERSGQLANDFEMTSQQVVTYGGQPAART